ncbi:MAG: hypothetical protein JKY67_13225 [Pseudomonadales bacterium]|nr:hypothetical protein [Pseudomonadales bacterium]
MLLSILYANEIVWADIAVIVHPSSGIIDVKKDALMRLYLGKRDSLVGVEVTPVDQSFDQPIRRDFYNRVVNKSLFQAKAYWSRMIFTGKGGPPTEFKTSREVKEWVSKTPQGLGYIDILDVDESVKVILVVR